VTEPIIALPDFMQDALPAAIFPIYPGLGPAHSMLNSTFWGLVIHMIAN